MTTKADEAEKDAYFHGKRGEQKYLKEKFSLRRQHAAIELCIPDSGEDWLDEMIQKARRDRLAGQALAGLCANPAVDLTVDLEGVHRVYSIHAYKIADEMLKAGDQ